jgi:hypothetical protein
MTEKTKNILHNLVAAAGLVVVILPDYLVRAPEVVGQLQRDVAALPQVPIVVKIGRVVGALALLAAVGSRVVLYGQLLRKIARPTEPEAATQAMARLTQAAMRPGPADRELEEMVRG